MRRRAAGMVFPACEAMWFDPRRLGRPIWRGGELAGRHDGWNPCPAESAGSVSVNGHSRFVCLAHLREVAALVALGLADRVRWQTPTSEVTP